MTYDFTNERRMGDEEEAGEHEEGDERGESSEWGGEMKSTGTREGPEDEVEPAADDEGTPSGSSGEGDVMAPVEELDPEREEEGDPGAAAPDRAGGEGFMPPASETGDRRVGTTEEEPVDSPGHGADERMSGAEHDEATRASEGDDADEPEAGEEHLMPASGDRGEGYQRPDEDDNGGETRRAEGGKRMDPVSDEVTGTGARAEPSPGREDVVPIEEEGEGYVRLQVRVEDGEMSVVDVKTVEGPLVAPGKVAGELIYEVTRGERPVTADTVIASSVRRSYPPPDEPEAHHTEVPMSELEFAVRIPRKELTEDALSEFGIGLYRTKDSLQRPVGDEEPLAAQFDRELREVARLDSIRLEQLDETVRDQLRAALG